LLLGQREKSVELLLQTPTDNPNFHMDSLKAAIVSASISTEAFKNTMKLIGTNLIANNNIDEGIQMLCLIGKSFDACRYLQSYDRWTDSIWLAKIALPEEECSDIMRRWAKFLSQSDQKFKAAHILASLGDFHGVLQLLYESHQSDIGVPFASACIENGLLSWENDSPIEAENNLQNQTSQNLLIPLDQLLQSLYLDYGYFLNRIGNISCAEYYWSKAGTAGQNTIETTRLSNAKEKKN
jgi:hypothetical protein